MSTPPSPAPQQSAPPPSNNESNCNFDHLGDQITGTYVRPGHPNDGNEGDEGNEGSSDCSGAVAANSYTVCVPDFDQNHFFGLSKPHKSGQPDGIWINKDKSCRCVLAHLAIAPSAVLLSPVHRVQTHIRSNNFENVGVYLQSWNFYRSKLYDYFAGLRSTLVDSMASGTCEPIERIMSPVSRRQSARCSA